MLRVVVVLLELEPWVLDRLDPHVEAVLGARALHDLGELRHGELLRELVEDAELAPVGGIRHRQLDALQRVQDVQVAARLPALAVDRERVADDRLDAEPVQRRAEHVVVVEPRGEPVVELRLVGLDPVDDTLVQIGRTDPPHPAREVDVVRVVDLRQVVQAARELRVEDRLLAPVVLDVEVPLLDVDVGCAVLAHRAELHEVRVGRVLAHRPQHVQGVHDVVVLREHRVVPVPHRVRRGRHLAVVHDRVGAEVPEQVGGDVPFDEVAFGDADLLAGDVLPGVGARRQRVEDRHERVRADLLVGVSPEVVVDDVHVVAALREPHRGGPAEVSVATQDQDPHQEIPSEEERDSTDCTGASAATRHRYGSEASASSTRSTSSTVW